MVMIMQLCSNPLQAAYHVQRDMICSREMSERQFLEQQGSFAREEIFVASVNQAGLVGSGRSSGVNFLRLWGLCCDVGMVMERKGVIRSLGRMSGCMAVEMWSC